jgi:hypothetical protein
MIGVTNRSAESIGKQFETECTGEAIFLRQQARLVFSQGIELGSIGERTTNI